MLQDTQIVLPFARLRGKTLQADFDAGTVSSDGGVLLLRETESVVGIIGRYARALDDPRDPRYTDHSYEEMLRQRIFQIACGYDDANDCNLLRHDPAFKAACERLPLLGEPLASQSSVSRLENAPRRTELYRLAQALLETFLASYTRAPQALVLDIEGIHLRRDNGWSIAYSEELIFPISATLQTTDRHHEILGQERCHFQLDS
jgi:hypothetical protein